MILVIVNKELNKRTGRYEQVVSHGINLDSDNDQIVILPSVSPEAIGAKWSVEMQEYYL
jgi:hypothetical protein